MANHDYFEVTCIAVVPDRPFYKVGVKYSAMSSNHGQGPQYWVGIPGDGGWHFSVENFKIYFKR